MNQVFGLSHIDMVSVFGKGEVNNIFSEFSHGALFVMADMSSSRSGIDYYHVIVVNQSAESCFVGVSPTDWPDLTVVTFEKQFEVTFQGILDSVDKACSPVIPFSWVAFSVSMGKI